MKISNFIDWIKINKQYADSTVKTYNMILKKFDKCIKTLTLNKRGVENTDLLTISDVEYYIAQEKVRGRSARTCNLHLAAIRDFFQFCERNHEKVMNYKEIILMKEKRRKIEALTEEEANKLITFMKADQSKDELSKIRDLSIVTVLLNTWLRVSELCNLKTEDVKRELQIIGKNQTLRLVHLFEDHIQLLNLYLFMREQKDIKSEYLFCSHSKNSCNTNKPLSRNSVEKIIREAWVSAWIKDPVWPHKLRHTFATFILRRWWNIYYIKELLGHQNISTTQTYLSATNDDLKRTQELLLNDAKHYEQEVLMPMPEQTIIKDNTLFNRFQDFLEANWLINNVNQNYWFNNQQFYNQQLCNQSYNQWWFNWKGVPNYGFGWYN